MHLIAQGQEPHHRWRKPLGDGVAITLGRSAHGFSVPWDPHISSQHAELKLLDDSVNLTRLPAARNAIFVDGKEVDNADLKLGQHFVIGSTTFTLSDARVEVTLDQPQPDQEQQFNADYLRELRYRDAEKRIHVLSQLPEIIGEAPSDTSLLLRLTGALFLGMPQADTVAIVRLHAANRGDNDADIAASDIAASDRGQRKVEVLHWDRKTLTGAEFRPSQRLIESALDQAASTLHIWERENFDRSSKDQVHKFTQREDHTWAFCTPVPGIACNGWAIYVGGTLDEFSDSGSDTSNNSGYFRDDLKFTETVAAMLGNLRALKQLERTQTTFRQFFSAPVLESLRDRDPEEALAPRLTDLSVLFCDLRSFSSHSEQSAGDLLGLLGHISSAIAIMTRCILDHGGVIGDFQGDSAMGFWGWPIPDDQRASRACAAAVAIRDEFARQSQDDNALEAGIGIASGKGVAGKIGTPDQVKVTVFGPVVNLAARLEGMTRMIHVPILIDQHTSKAIGADSKFQAQEIADVIPYGLNTKVTVNMLQSAKDPIDSDKMAQLQAGSQAMAAGDWQQAKAHLAKIASDPAAKFLLETMRQHGDSPPKDWDGIIHLASK